MILMEEEITRGICGLWIDPEGKAHLSVGQRDGTRAEVVEDFRPYAWAEEGAAGGLPEGAEAVELSGPGRFRLLLRFRDLESWRAFLAERRPEKGIDVLRSLESQFLIAQNERMFAGVRFDQLRRCQCDIETSCCEPSGFSNARRAGDRVLAIGLQWGERQELLTIEDCTDAGERRLLIRFAERLAEEDPDVIEGHNIFRFDLDYLRLRCRRYRLPCAWGRFGQVASFRTSRLKVAERWIDYPRCDIPGRAVVDTYLLVLLFDLAGREMGSYGLKEVALHLGITGDGTGGDAGLMRTYLRGREIECAFHDDREKFLAYLADDLRETRGIGDRLLPTYFAQAASFPMTLQEATLRGTSGKVDLLMLQEYYQAGQALPLGGEVRSFAGGFTRSFECGVFRNVWHFDVASLYPSLLLLFNRNPARDSLGAFIPLLRRLREYRLKYKTLARTTTDDRLREEYQARQNNYKILINSFYGYLGFSGARFADGDLAAKVTAEGRLLLQKLIERFRGAGSRILEADTDGIYLTAPQGVDRPEKLLEKVAADLPEGIDLEFDGSYEAMFCYKAKNYALYDGNRVILRGSALRSRGMEPFLQRLTTRLIRWLLGLEEESPKDLLEAYRQRIFRGEIEIGEIARSENLSQHPEAYQRAVEADTGPNRRASMEAALRLTPVPRMGDRITYYIARPMGGGRPPDWQRARPVQEYDPERAPLDADYYLKKLDEWARRYAEFVMPSAPRLEQGELF
jgi:DNA polymerase, archaea type